MNRTRIPHSIDSDTNTNTILKCISITPIHKSFVRGSNRPLNTDTQITDRILASHKLLMFEEPKRVGTSRKKKIPIDRYNESTFSKKTQIPTSDKVLKSQGSLLSLEEEDAPQQQITSTTLMTQRVLRLKEMLRRAKHTPRRNLCCQQVEPSFSSCHPMLMGSRKTTPAKKSSPSCFYNHDFERQLLIKSFRRDNLILRNKTSYSNVGSQTKRLIDLKASKTTRSVIFECRSNIKIPPFPQQLQLSTEY